MRVPTANGTIQFEVPEHDEYPRAPYALRCWKDFHSENSRPGCEGEAVELVLFPESYEAPLAAPEDYGQSIEWLQLHQEAVRDAALTALLKHVDQLRREYGIEDEELDSVNSESDLQRMVDLSFVHVFPRDTDGTPRYGLEFECNWDPEHGCGVSFRGAQAMDYGSDAAQICP